MSDLHDINCTLRIAWEKGNEQAHPVCILSCTGARVLREGHTLPQQLGRCAIIPS